MSYYLLILIQILLVIHVLKTGRNRYWIWLLVFLPVIGGIAYLVIEILPGFSGSITGQRALREVRQAVNPGAELRQHEAAWQQSRNTDNARRYVDALLASGQVSEAMTILDQAMTGLFSTEPSLMLLKAQAEFEQQQYDEAVHTLQALQEANPDFRSPEGHLLLARALEAAGDVEAALQAYASVATYYPGAEARYRHALALANAGQNTDAMRAFESMIKDAQLAPRHFQKSQKHWLRLAEDQLKALKADD